MYTFLYIRSTGVYLLTQLIGGFNWIFLLKGLNDNFRQSGTFYKQNTVQFPSLSRGSDVIIGSSHANEEATVLLTAQVHTDTAASDQQTEMDSSDVTAASKDQSRKSTTE